MNLRPLIAASIVAGGAFAGWSGAHVADWVSGSWTAAAPGTSLAPWHPGMSLDATFETLPNGEHPAPRLQLLGPNDVAWAARWRLIADARERIDVSYFILKEDVFGISFLGHLLHKARQGVQVRILLDAQGTAMSRSPLAEDYLDELVNTGNVDARVYRPRIGRVLQAVMELSLVPAFASEHDKILVADGARSLVGGRNIAAEYFAAPSELPTSFQDYDIEVEGGRVADLLTEAFEAQYLSESAEPVRPENVSLASRAADLLQAYEAMDDWVHGRPLAEREVGQGLGVEVPGPSWDAQLRRHPSLRGVLRERAPATFTADVRIVDSHPRRGRADDDITELLRRLLASARHDVLIASPYLVLSEEALQLLERASRRGVHFTVLTNSPISSDNALSQAFFLEQWPELLARVPTLRLFARGDERTLHSKVVVVDNQVTVVSTYNLEPISMAVDSEVAVVARSPAVAAAAGAPLRSLIARGPPFLYEYRLERSPSGAPLRDAEGHLQVAFGPEDHTDPERWTQLITFWRALQAMERFAGFDPIF